MAHLHGPQGPKMPNVSLGANLTLTEIQLMDRNWFLFMRNIGISIGGVLFIFAVLFAVDEIARCCGLGARLDQLSRVVRANNAETERNARMFKLQQWRGWTAGSGTAQSFYFNASLCIFCLLELLIYTVSNIGVSQTVRRELR